MSAGRTMWGQGVMAMLQSYFLLSLFHIAAFSFSILSSVAPHSHLFLFPRIGPKASSSSGSLGGSSNCPTNEEQWSLGTKLHSCLWPLELCSYSPQDFQHRWNARVELLYFQCSPLALVKCHHLHALTCLLSFVSSIMLFVSSVCVSTVWLCGFECVICVCVVPFQVALTCSRYPTVRPKRTSQNLTACAPPPLSPLVLTHVFVSLMTRSLCCVPSDTCLVYVCKSQDLSKESWSSLKTVYDGRWWHDNVKFRKIALCSSLVPLCVKSGPSHFVRGFCWTSWAQVWVFWSLGVSEWHRWWQTFTPFQHKRLKEWTQTPFPQSRSLCGTAVSPDAHRPKMSSTFNKATFYRMSCRGFSCGWNLKDLLSVNTHMTCSFLSWACFYLRCGKENLPLWHFCVCCVASGVLWLCVWLLLWNSQAVCLWCPHIITLSDHFIASSLFYLRVNVDVGACVSSRVS